MKKEFINILIFVFAPVIVTKLFKNIYSFE